MYSSDSLSSAQNIFSNENYSDDDKNLNHDKDTYSQDKEELVSYFRQLTKERILSL